MQTVKAAVVQAGSFVFDNDRTLEKARTFVRRAAGAGAALVVFPEAFIGGYPKGLDFGARIGSRTPEGRDDFRRYWQAGIEVPGPETAALGEMAIECLLHLVVGVIERDGGTLYCTSLCFGPDGALLGKHRKLMPTASERLVWGFGDGSTLPAVRLGAGTIGMAICWENYMP
ncbi:MAG TPA: nitrilase-related carbon-nitrogen hydrolase, partial [Vicinamibacterales bacterium]|nr:nitrilase-related carbon-nitrogen hydrolase [Vicinamibacterales bacterium]